MQGLGNVRCPDVPSVLPQIHIRSCHIFAAHNNDKSHLENVRHRGTQIHKPIHLDDCLLVVTTAELGWRVMNTSDGAKLPFGLLGN